jgi:hypothetical protein
MCYKPKFTKGAVMKQIVFDGTPLSIYLSPNPDFMVRKQYMLKSQVISPVFSVTSSGFCSYWWWQEFSFFVNFWGHN